MGDFAGQERAFPKATKKYGASACPRRIAGAMGFRGAAPRS
jgi:hypothetical protein